MLFHSIHRPSSNGSRDPGLATWIANWSQQAPKSETETICHKWLCVYVLIRNLPDVYFIDVQAGASGSGLVYARGVPHCKKNERKAIEFGEKKDSNAFPGNILRCELSLSQSKSNLCLWCCLKFFLYVGFPIGTKFFVFLFGAGH